MNSEPQSAPPDSPAAPARRWRFLLVDDEPLLLLILEEYLKDLDASFAAATSGKEALALAESTAFDLAITDRMMPGMDGFQLTSELRKINPQLKVLLISGLAAPASAASLPSPPDAFLAKPFTRDSLQTAVRGLLGQG